MTTLGRREKCLRKRSGKGHLLALGARRTRNRPLSAPLMAPWTQTGQNLAAEGRSVYKATWNRSAKTVIPVKGALSGARDHRAFSTRETKNLRRRKKRTGDRGREIANVG